jgi:hypothetical protein
LKLLRRYARDPDFVAAFTRDTGHSVPASLIQPQDYPLSGPPSLGGYIQIMQSEEDWSAFLTGRTSKADLLAFSLYILRHLRDTGWSPTHEAPLRSHATLYDEDFYAWTKDTAARIRAGDWDAIDGEAVAEEIESLGKRDRRELASRLEVLAAHLLKWSIQQDYRTHSHSWADTIAEQRRQLDLLLEDSPSLQQTVPDVLARRYDAARRQAARETRLPLATFPETCPWSPAQVLDADFWPEGC